VALAVALAACVGDDPAPQGTTDTTGAEGAPCFANGTCLTADLVCLSDRCVRMGDQDGGMDPEGGTDPDAAPPDSGDPRCTGNVPSKATGPTCPTSPSGSCETNQKCCAPGEAAEFSCVESSEACNESLPVVECEDVTHCTGGNICCLSGSEGSPCKYSLKGTRCRDGCEVGETELCSATTACSSGTCRAITITTPLDDVASGACLP
jgi:hypothetical protein